MKKLSIIALFLSVFMLAGCSELLQFLQLSKVEKPTARVSSARITSLSFSEAQILVDIQLQNPNNLSIKLAAMDYDLSINEFSLISGNKDDELSIAARDSSLVQLPFTLRYDDLYNSLKSLSGKDTSSYNFSGGLSFDVPVLGQVRVPVSKSGILPLLRLPKVNLEKLKLNTVSWTGADLQLDVSVESFGGLELFVDKLDYSLQVNGRKWLDSAINKRIDLAQEGKKIISIPFKLDFLEMGRSAYDAIMGDAPLSYDFSGLIKVGSENPLLKDASFNFEDLSSVELWK